MERKEKQTWVQLVIAIIVAAIVIIAIFGLLNKGVFEDTQDQAQTPQDDHEAVVSEELSEEPSQDAPLVQNNISNLAEREHAQAMAALTQESTDEMPEAITTHTLAIVAGVETTQTNATIEVSYDLFESNPAEITVTYGIDGRRRGTETRHFDLVPGNDTLIMTLEGLEPATTYNYTLEIEDTNAVAPSMLLPTGSFQTLPIESDTIIPPEPEPQPLPEPPFEVDEDRGIEYATPGGVSLKANVYMPQDVPGSVPVVVWVHGGGWDSGNRNGADQYARAIAPEGIAVVSVEYRLTTEGADYIDMVDDIRQGIEFVYANESHYDYDAQNITLLGTSAGGTLAALVGAGQEGSGASVFGIPARNQRIAKVINVFGPTDFMAWADHFGGAMTEARSQSARNFMGGCSYADYQDRECAGLETASPVEYVDDDMPPFMMLHGDRDTSVPLAQSTAFHQAALAQGAQSQFFRSSQRGHDKDIVLDYFEEVVGFIKEN